MKRISLLIFACFLSSANAQTRALRVPNEVRQFIESGSKAIALESADLNGDGRTDYILVLERENPTEKDEYDYPKNQRPLLILVRGADKKLTEAKHNEQIVMCSDCGGMMGDPFVGVTVARNTFTVNHYGGSAWRWSVHYKFNYSRIDKTWQLVRVEKDDFHAADQMKTLKRQVLIPPRDFGKVDITDFDPATFEEGEVLAFLKINVDDLNQQIEKAASTGEAWVKMPTQVIARLIDEFAEIQSRTIEMKARGTEGPTSMSITVTDDGVLDDSIRTERQKFELKTNEQGVWKFVSGEKTWRCQDGRGHQDFSAESCL